MGACGTSSEPVALAEGRGSGHDSGGQMGLALGLQPAGHLPAPCPIPQKVSVLGMTKEKISLSVRTLAWLRGGGLETRFTPGG